MAVKKVELNIPNHFQEEPFFYTIIKTFKVIPYIIEASFSTETGWAIVKFEGDEEEIEKLFKFLKEKGVEITF